MLESENIVCISWVDWDGLPIAMHQMMTRLSRRNRVLFVEPTVALTSFLAHPGRSRSLGRKLGLWWKGLRTVGPNLQVYHPPPVLVTPGHFAINDAASQWFYSAVIGGVVKKLELFEPILWIYDPYAVRPDSRIDEKLLCYDCNDEISTFARFDYKKRRLQAMEDRLTRQADVVFATSRALYEKRLTQNTNTHYLPSGVDFELFNRACSNDCRVPDEIARLPEPVIGYHGMISNHRIEWEWIEALSQARPDASIVFIGPTDQKAPPREIHRLDNVHFLGPKPMKSLPGYLRAFSVGIIPYKGKEFLQGCQPTKTFEYFAAGKMVVSSLIPELQNYPLLARVSNDRNEFVSNVALAVAEGRDPERKARCVEAAREKTWDARVEMASRLIDEALAAGAGRKKTSRKQAVRRTDSEYAS